MAILIKQENQKSPLARVFTAAVGIIFTAIGTYYLFFAKAPLVEVIAPPELDSITDLAESGIDIKGVIESQEYSALNEHVAPPEIGEYGRANPFARF